ncbi:MAG: hypothetical protein QM723_12195 [Myxococcaceae bacterium]
MASAGEPTSNLLGVGVELDQLEPERLQPLQLLQRALAVVGVHRANREQLAAGLVGERLHLVVLRARLLEVALARHHDQPADRDLARGVG